MSKINCNNQPSATVVNKQKLVNGKWKIFCATLALLSCSENAFAAYNTRLHGKNPHNNINGISEESIEIDKIKTQILEIQQKLDELKQTVENNRQEMIGATNYLKNYVNKQIEKSSKIRSDEDDQGIE